MRTEIAVLPSHNRFVLHGQNLGLQAHPWQRREALINAAKSDGHFKFSRSLQRKFTISFKIIIYSVVSHSMNDNEIIKLVWGVMVLKQRFEDDPYSLSVEEIELLREHYNVKPVEQFL